MGTLALVRHGQASFAAAVSDARTTDRDPGRSYDRLSELGVAQARALGARWCEAPPEAIYSGPLQRQLDTASIAREVVERGGHALPAPIVLPELAEFPAFELLARCLPQVAAGDAALQALIASGDRAALYDRALWKVVDGWIDDRLELGDLESYRGFVERVGRGLARITGDHPAAGARVAAVTSGGPIGVALKLSLGVDDHAMVALWGAIRNASITELRWRTLDAGFTLFGFNHADHLPPSLLTFR